MKRFVKLMSAVLAFCLLCVVFVGCGQEETSLTYVGMRINPEIELVVNDEGTVVAVNAVNEDGETVLCELTLVGLTVEEAAAMFTEVATELGFVDVDSEENTVYIFAEGENEELVKEIKEKIYGKVNAFFEEKGIFGRAVEEIISEELDELADKWNVNVRDAKLVERILEMYPEMTEEEVLALTLEEKLDLIKEYHKNNGLTADIREKYKEDVELLKQEYAELFEMREELESLEMQLQNEDLTEDERAALQEEYDTLKAEHDALREQYLDEACQMKEEKKQEVEDAKEAFRQEADRMREEFSEHLNEHLERYEQHKHSIEEQIKNWQNMG